ncbi:uncharacterized protein FIBRA_05586 [Fibroporia radiculosa]|uniref:NYN domain-containing protein n=1 Tax=Fibroporia radiculosa TaxID=599839 RepID=J4G9R9_9APHY|nr:uncharacterized protein FIBRA_05586 [Fibroporia radiculosa]CCM03453.1 predicted protein [Fibroporia radiculosa]
MVTSPSTLNSLPLPPSYAPDLGAFTTVFRALNNFQPRTGPGPGHVENHSATSASSLVFTPSDNDSEPAPESTVWSRRPVASYLSYYTPGGVSRGRSPRTSDTDSTASDLDRTHLTGAIDGSVGTVGQPSLGYLDEALGFIAAERAKFVAQRDMGLRGHNSSSTTTTSDSVWRHAIQPRRKRRRKKNRSAQEVSRVRMLERDPESLTETATGDATAADEDDGDVDDAYDSSSSVDVPSSSPRVRSKTVIPARNDQERRRYRSPISVDRVRLQHSKSTPNLIPPVSLPLDARVLHLRNLAHKLRLFFPQDAISLNAILSTESAYADFVDTRGPEPRSQDTLIHVFVDHSNILIGFLTYLRRHLHHMNRSRSKHISHAALALILERGRPITRRVLVASSPLYQPVNTAEQIGYEVRVYARVPDTGDGADRQHYTHSNNNGGPHTTSRGRDRKGAAQHVRGHSHKNSLGGGTSTESDTGTGVGIGVNGGGGASRVRYREQGVDELLQLKLHQAIAGVDEVPPGATIVLATGDGNVGQFNEEGFLGCVRTALKKGWSVELYAWEGGLSRAWLREFGEGPYSKKFEVYMLDRFAADLLEV